MFVSRSMTRKVITVNPETTIFEAQELMAANRIRHLPVVVADNKLVGIVTDRDLRSALPYRFFKEGISPAETESLKSLRVKDIMTQKVITIPPAYTIQDALMVIQNSRVGALPVVDDEGRLRGIISVRDLLRAFINVLGIGQPGTLLCILVEEKVGQLKRIVDAITEMGVSFGSVLVARYWDENKRAVFPYLLTQNVAQVKKKLQAMGYELLDPMQWYIDQLPEEERPQEKPKS
ncbi:MAG TPA: CBS and ACT domain-containing protein [Desulfobacterales bacterium]|nr:CBS and ACT domain-containing protein [Desulfobacterales bacterium]